MTAVKAMLTHHAPRHHSPCETGDVQPCVLWDRVNVGREAKVRRLLQYKCKVEKACQLESSWQGEISRWGSLRPVIVSNGFGAVIVVNR